MTEISIGTKATCRYCGHEVIYEPWYRDGRGPNPPVWSHTRSGTKSCSTRPVGWDADGWPFAAPASRDSEPTAGVRDAARQASGQQPETCRPVEVDGQPVLVRGSGNWTEQEGHFMAEVVRAAKRRYEAEHPAVGQQDATQPTTGETEARAAAFHDAIRIVLNRVKAYEGMSQEAVSLNRERSAIVDELRRLAAGAES